AAMALAAPYAVLCGALALASRSRLATPSLPQAVVAGFLIALCAGGLGAARAAAPWDRLARLLPPRPRSVVLGTAGALAVLGVAGGLLAGGAPGPPPRGVRRPERAPRGGGGRGGPRAARRRAPPAR